MYGKERDQTIGQSGSQKVYINEHRNVTKKSGNNCFTHGWIMR